MFCLPDETMGNAVSTIDLNAAIGTRFMFTTLFLPFPKTDIAEYCIKKKYLKPGYTFKDMPESFIFDSVLEIDDKDSIVNLHKVAHLCLRFPRFRRMLIWLAGKIRSSKLFFLLWLVSTFIRYKEERKLSFFETVKQLWFFRKGY